MSSARAPETRHNVSFVAGLSTSKYTRADDDDDDNDALAPFTSAQSRLINAGLLKPIARATAAASAVEDMARGAPPRREDTLCAAHARSNARAACDVDDVDVDDQMCVRALAIARDRMGVVQ